MKILFQDQFFQKKCSGEEQVFRKKWTGAENFVPGKVLHFVGIMHQKSSIYSHPISIPHLYVLSHMRMRFASVKACCVEMAESDNDEIVEQVYHYITKSEYPSGVGEHRKRGI